MHSLWHVKVSRQSRADTSCGKTYFYHAYSIWLFTRSDLKTIVIPSSLFGVLNSTYILLNAEDKFDIHWPLALWRAFLALFWVWINLLPFNIDNQRRDDAIIEDRLNKPWRTMPSGRMTPMQAKISMFCIYVTALFSSLRIGGAKQCLTMMFLGFIYNELRLADRGWFSRNAVNALGFCCFASGALEVALPMSIQALPAVQLQVFPCLGVTAGVVFSTVQLQDMADQGGDSLRNRVTMPLALGDSLTRHLTAVAMVTWLILCPRFWNLGLGSSIVFGGLGGTIAYRTLAFRSVSADQRTFLLWNIWVSLLYSFPLLTILC
ncbi:UbiA prenyltransferase family-domain-containing protein [Xylaria nigripes]|nr:UbiA prenyltransferase family-domain-containing protein [Xylaria nigripes]